MAPAVSRSSRKSFPRPRWRYLDGAALLSSDLDALHAGANLDRLRVQELLGKRQAPISASLVCRRGTKTQLGTSILLFRDTSRAGA